MSDFGFEHSFKNAVSRLHEHYGFKIGETAVTRVTLKHAHRIGENQNSRPPVGALPACGAGRLVAESDGCLLPIVETADTAGDRRRTRKVDFQEARLNAAQAVGKATIVYEAGFTDVDQTGWLWAQAVREAGWGLDSNIHALGDGAPWIRNQAGIIFGKQGSYLIDYFHLCEYLSAAAPTCAKDPKRWMNTQKKRLKAGRYEKVIEALKSFIEAENIPKEQAPVRAACRYMNNRRDCFFYDQALAQDLPIGSGLIESGHKHILQARLKIAGAAWKRANADAMAQARAYRANGQWNNYWTKSAA
jgi:hypothetical protein